ncbi:putative dienelactone hydrolase [Calothrix sp. NIES-4071]|nr:putative dienelactone hydrolase [Calothrix sp. NIES-4071]BAZ55686.1 putative dienelactone hydrolase [Calothrix sp. NIES-4105]
MLYPNTQSLFKSSLSIIISLLTVGVNFMPNLFTRPALGADRINLSYGILQRSIPITSLELYARTGKIDSDFAAYAQYVDEKELPQLRRVLLAPIPLNAVAVSQFLYSPIGQTLLERLGEIIQLESGQNGFYAIRSALIISAAQKERFTLLDVLRNYSSNAISINLSRTQEIVQAIQTIINQTQNAVSLINQESRIETTTTPVPAATLLQTRRFQTQKLTLPLIDQSRNRIINTDIYLPATINRRPVIVISHGLGSDRTSFAYLAQYLAQSGFVVAVPEHPGSNAQQLQALLDGRADTVTNPREFIDRPLDIKFLLDELTRRQDSNTALRGRLNLQQVGVVGQSFGGYTALTLAGAKINYEQLGKDCPALKSSLNVSQLLQCLAATLPQNQYNLSDPRIKAVIAINPVSSSILGQAGLSEINIPVMIVAGSADTVAPALPEQIQPFTWLTTPNKYLALINGGTHFSTIAESKGSVVPVPEQAIGQSPESARFYINALSVPFFQTYVAGQRSYTRYLNAGYASTISQTQLPLSLVQSITPKQLQQALNGSPLSSRQR